MKKITLENGLRIIVEEKKESKTAAIVITVGFGSNHEKDEHSGVAHFMEHMLFKGTKKRTFKQINTEICSVGGDINAGTNNDCTRYLVVIPSEYVAKGIDVLLDMILNSQFDKKELEKERKVILEEIRMYEDKHTERVHEIFLAELYAKHNIRRPVQGTINTVNALSRKDMLYYYNNYYVPNNIIVTVVGGIDTANIINNVKKVFSKANKKEIPKYFSPEEAQIVNIKEKTIKKQTEQAHIALGFRFPTLINSEWVTGDIITTYLGQGLMARLFQEVREKRGLAYGVYADYDYFTDYGCVSIYAGTEKKNLEIVRKLIIKELNRLKTKRLSAKELNNTKTYIKGSRVLREEKSEVLAMSLSWYELFDKAEAYKDYPAKIDKVTSEDIQSVMKKYFDDKKYAFAAIIPED